MSTALRWIDGLAIEAYLIVLPTPRISVEIMRKGLGWALYSYLINEGMVESVATTCPFSPLVSWSKRLLLLVPIPRGGI